MGARIKRKIKALLGLSKLSMKILLLRRASRPIGSQTVSGDNRARAHLRRKRFADNLKLSEFRRLFFLDSFGNLGSKVVRNLRFPYASCNAWFSNFINSLKISFFILFRTPHTNNIILFVVRFQPHMKDAPDIICGSNFRCCASLTVCRSPAESNSQRRSPECPRDSAARRIFKPCVWNNFSASHFRTVTGLAPKRAAAAACSLISCHGSSDISSMLKHILYE